MWFCLGSGIGEHTLNLGSKSRDNGGVEELVEPCEDDTADDNTDDDLDARIDISLTGGGLDGGLCGDYCGIELVLDGVDKIFHRINYLVLSLIFYFGFSLITVVQILISQHS